MPDGVRQLSPTRSALLELAEERRLVHEGYEFLDEKRMLIAAELLRELERYETLQRGFVRQYAEAVQQLVAAAGRHGLDGLSVYPPYSMEARLLTQRRSFLGVSLVTAVLEMAPPPAPPLPVNPSPEARLCAERFRALLEPAAQLAAAAGNLARLAREYTRTERRARALENVLLPEIDADLAFISEQLEALDQEEAIRVRSARERRA